MINKNYMNAILRSCIAYFRKYSIMTIVSSFGNKELLKLRKTVFLCSREIPTSVVIKCYDWAIEQRQKGNCIISGFHSQIEKDVFYYLLAGSQPIIMVLARGMKQKISPELKPSIEAGRLLIVSPFETTITYVSSKTAEKRNSFMLELADDIVIGFVSKGGMLEKLLAGIHDKPIQLIHRF